MSQWEEDFPDDEMMGSPKPKPEAEKDDKPEQEPAKEPEETNVAPESEPATSEPAEPTVSPPTEPATSEPAEPTIPDDPDDPTIPAIPKPAKPVIPEPAEPAIPEPAEPAIPEPPRPRTIPAPKPEVPKKFPSKLPVKEKEEEEDGVGNKIATSDDIIHEQESRLEAELKQLLVDIRRVGEEGKPQATFGELFDDEQVANYYEALVGTLKSAKKRNLVDFKGQMLLKGPHDNVVISIVGE